MTSFAALGDSITLGVGDPVRPAARSGGRRCGGTGVNWPGGRAGG